MSCVAAPIFGPLGAVVAALSVTGPTALVRADRVGPAVRLAAASRAYRARYASEPRVSRRRIGPGERDSLLWRRWVCAHSVSQDTPNEPTRQRRP